MKRKTVILALVVMALAIGGKQIIEQAAAQKTAPHGSNTQKVGDLYTG